MRAPIPAPSPAVRYDSPASHAHRASRPDLLVAGSRPSRRRRRSRAARHYPSLTARVEPTAASAAREVAS
jgi:hypothetical protein